MNSRERREHSRRRMRNLHPRCCTCEVCDDRKKWENDKRRKWFVVTTPVVINLLARTQALPVQLDAETQP